MDAVIKIEAHIEETKPGHQGNAPTDFHPKAAEIESIKVVAHVDGVPSALADMTLTVRLCHPHVLVT